MESSKDLFFDVRLKEYQKDQNTIVESEINNHLKLKKCKAKNSKKK